MRPSSRVRQLLTEPISIDDLAQFGQRAEEAHKSQNDALTKLRLLASRPGVRAAEELHNADEAVVKAVLGPEGLAPDSEWKRVRAKQKTAREQLINEARKMLRLDKGAQIMAGRT